MRFAALLAATVVVEGVLFRYFGVRTQGLFAVLQYAVRGLGTVAESATGAPSRHTQFIVSKPVPSPVYPGILESTRNLMPKPSVRQIEGHVRPRVITLSLIPSR